jgi:hypothetical protein
LAASCARRSPLARSGLTQAGRHLAELGADYFRVDERDIADLILFGRRYAKHIRYYEVPPDNGKGDWSNFFESDVSANLAALAKLPVEATVAFQRDLETWLKADDHRDPQLLGAHFKLLFHLPLALLQTAGDIAERLPQNEQLRAQAAELARRELAQPIEGLIGWYKGAIQAGPGQIFPDGSVKADDYKLAASASDPRLRLPSAIQAALIGRQTPRNEPLPLILSGAIGSGDWSDIWKKVEADDAPYRDGGTSAYERIYDALEFNLLESSFRTIYRAAARLKRDAQARLAESLEQFGGHEPHYGLWLAFLRLFRHAQESLNGFTERHLDFYFRDVLQLRARSPVPDRTHLLFELAKGVEAIRIPEGTAFRAGNDALGRPVRYRLDQELIVNRGRVAELRGIRLDRGYDGTVAFASTALRSLDGTGEVPLAPGCPSWPAFGPADAPKARIGFAVADRKLFLREGARSIRLIAEFARRLDFLPASSAWRFRLTGPDGWWEPTDCLTVTVNEGAVAGSLVHGQGTKRPRGERFRKRGRGARAKPMIEFKIELGADAPPIVPFDPALHGGESAGDGLPRIELIFDFERSSSPAAFEAMQCLRLEELDLEVRASGVKQLSVVAGGATVDPAKPFAPFGPQPRPGSALIVGSSEIFSKPLANLSLTLDWQEEYVASGYFRKTPASEYDVAEAILASGQWQGTGGDHALFGSGKSTTINIDGTGLVAGDVAQTLANQELATTSASGFVRLSLTDDFGHRDYPAEYARAMVRLARGEEYDPPDIFSVSNAAQAYAQRMMSHYPGRQQVNEARSMPLKPYDPVVTRIEASYRSTTDSVECLLHLLPFGEVRADLDDGQLFPCFDHAGSLLIGVADFVSPARLSLLVQVADGSGDPLKRPPKLRFEYLAGDRWEAFDESDVDDKTDNFAGSGLIGLALPQAADRKHRAMPEGLHWIRISVDDDIAALNRLLSIDAQAGRAVFADDGNDPAFLETPLPADTIAKLVVPLPAIKKLRQPYSSFGGRPAESADAFAARVSERLRHKDRAVAAFDYEALILEAFPQLFRAKCLSTTAMVRDDGRRIIADNEVSPGAVTVVAVPWTHNVNWRNPLRPYADQALLTAIDKYLKARVSPFVRLEVQNPKFEEVQAAFKVRFRPDIADIAFYRDELNAALVEFLTPWSRPGGGEVMFGGKLWKSSLINFVEERAEVDFVTDFELYHKPDVDAGDADWTPVDVELIEATTARSILVSAPSHQILEVSSRA